MKTGSRCIISFIACMVLIFSFSAQKSAANDVFVVSADRNGDANYMGSNGDGSFSSQERLLIMGDSGIGYYSYGNGMGDFDNDGDFDYIIGDGIISGNIFLFEKTGSGNQFASPVAVAGWSTGYFAMDMAVADFDEDGNYDFIMSHNYSYSCGLYLGDGSLGFRGPESGPGTDGLLLENASPYLSAGADAADFNNDGHADFVIAPFPNPTDPSSGEPFSVNLGDGRGNFTTHPFEGLKDADDYFVPYYGVAAADFDRDGKVDIAAAYYDYLDMYKGNGDGTFEWVASYEYDLNLSPLDNYDFNGDGNQDIVAANFGSTGSDVAVFLGNGDGSFADPVIYGGGSSGERNAIAAPLAPPPEQQNKEPVAVVDPMYLEATVGDEIVFDASASYDEDGWIVSYAWDFGDGTAIAADTTVLSLSKSGIGTDEVSPSHIYYDVGKFTVTLNVTDDMGTTASVQAEVNALPVAATIEFRPETLYLNSKAKWFWATIRLPSNYDARKIDDPSVCIVMEDGSRICAYDDYGHGFLAKLRKKFFRRRSALTVRFKRQDLIRKIKIPSDSTKMMVQGDMLYNDAWIEFEGSGKIRTMEKKKRRSFFGRYWKRHKSHLHKMCGFRYRR